MAAAAVDLRPFFQAVIQHLAMSPGGVTFIAKLGLDPNIKSAWSTLNLSKSKKMATIIDTRPDLFSRYMTERAQPMVKLEPKGFECLATGEVPPMGLDAVVAANMVARMQARTATAAAVATAAASSSSCPSLLALQGLAALPSLPMPLPTPSVNLSPAEARKLFLRQVLDAVAVKDGCVMDLPALGSVPEVQQAWKMSGLDRRLKMSDVLKERPDLVMVSVSENGSAVVALTQLAILCVQNGDVPDPDATCPPPVQATKKKSSSGHRPNSFGAMRGHAGGWRHRYDPYAGQTAASLEQWSAAVGTAESQAQYWAIQ